MKKEKIIYEFYESQRIDKFISSALNISRSTVANLIDEGNILLNSKNPSKSKILQYGDILEINIPEAKPIALEPWDYPLDILFEDDYLLIVNKPKGMVVHPAPGHYENTLCHALINHCKGSLSGINGVMRPGIVHRIDKDTSGLLIVAKNDFAHNFLSEQIKEHSFTREYEAVCFGVFKQDNGIIEKPIGRHPIKRKEMSVIAKNSKYAKTEYFVEKRFNNFTHVRFKLYTGRTHQIRVHCKSIGHSIVGDMVYSNNKNHYNINGQCLHARKIGFIHPNSKEYLEFSSDLPEYFKDFLLKCENL